MPYPTSKVEIAFANNWYDTSPTWVDVTADVRQFSTSRGRTADLQPFDTGTAQIVLDNRTRKYDPLNTSSPYYGNLKPRRQIRITANAGAGFVPVFTGFISGFPTTWTDAGYDSTVTVDCFDLLGIIAGQRLPSDWSNYALANAIGVSPVQFYFPFNDPESSTVLTSSNNQTMTQTAGGVPFRTNSAIAPGVSRNSVNIGQGNTYKSVNRDPGFNNIGNVSVAFWAETYQLGALTGLVQVNAKNNLFFIYVNPNGSLTAVSYFPGGATFTASTTVTPFKDFTPHHVGATFDGLGTVRIYVDGVLASGATTAGTVTPPTIVTGQLFVNVIDNIFQDLAVYSPNDSVIWDAATFTYLYNLGVGQIVESTPARINRYLDSQNNTGGNTPVPNAWRNLTTTPQASVAAFDTNTSVLDGIQVTTVSEGGETYVNKAGQLTFLDRYAAISAASGAPAASFNDNGVPLSYGQNLEISIDDQNIRNDISVTFTAGGTVRAVNSASITANGTVQNELQTTLATVEQANALASYRRDIDATVVPQISAIDATTNTTNAAWQTLLNLELIISKIVVNRTPSTGSAITQPMVVLQIEHNVVPGQWQTRVTGTKRFTGWFVLDQSVLDGTDVLLT